MAGWTLYSKKARGFFASAAVKRDLRAASLCSYAASFLLFLSALLTAASFSIEHSTPSHASAFDDSFNSTALTERWARRREAHGYQLAGELVGAIGWFCLMPGVFCLAEVAGGAVVSTSKVVTSAFTVAALITVVDLTFSAGLRSTANDLSAWAQRDTARHPAAFSALQALEMAYLVADSRTVWLFALDDLMLGIGLAAAAHLAEASRQLSSRWSCFGLLTACVAAIGFLINVMQGVPSVWLRVSSASAVINAILDGFLLPIWVAWLAAQLRALSAEAGVYTNHLDSTPPAVQQPSGLFNVTAAAQASARARDEQGSSPTRSADSPTPPGSGSSQRPCSTSIDVLLPSC